MPKPRGWPVCVLLLVAASAAGQTGEKIQGTVKVTVREAQTVAAEPVLPVDPTPRIRFNPANLTVSVTTEQGQSLHLSHFPILHVNGQVFQPGQQPGGRFLRINQTLASGPGGKARQGFTTVFVQEDLHITMEAELMPTKPAKGAKTRSRSAMRIRYTVENKGTKAHTFGLKMYMDAYVVSNDGPLFAAPTFPDKILDGVELKDKTLPDYVQILQQPDLKNPGYVAHLTLHLGRSIEKPKRVVLTRHGAGGFQGWDLPAMQSMGDSALGLFWEPAEIKPGGKRELGYGYGQGIIPPADNEGRLDISLGGSFEPGKLFTVSALVHDPLQGQSLRLDLPPGIERLEGKEIQPVPSPRDDDPQSLVLWKCRILKLGEYPLRIHSSNGVTRTLTVTVNPRAE